MKNIALIGPRGVGKSKISRKLSKITGKPVVSTDMIAVYLTGGVSIPDFVKKHGGNWQPFRELEFEILSKLSSSRNLILDCGGGILFEQDSEGKETISERKVKILKENAFIISLSRKSDYLIEKIQNDPSRPPLSSVLSYKSILESRLPQYRAHSNIQIALDDRSTEEVCEEILHRSGWT
ncbi:shikimate kinase [Leptospira wolffii]|uniref:shikimate kinase n=1 Tax=Leptospira wolffii TaxID=409998 RepID=UPI001083518F|nr:shikimate kinase [Leptospira wolffii]TGK59378.1 shikimate kinase [Leptospira wolffii]TGK71239.1 shikimate kinase [Leptospira wolffii]TGK77806.1 shikimate kinase [Leptospira wolffii]TGL29483.1 shikimate kinase [Leptospira wolffii]